MLHALPLEGLSDVYAQWRDESTCQMLKFPTGLSRAASNKLMTKHKCIDSCNLENWSQGSLNNPAFCSQLTLFTFCISSTLNSKPAQLHVPALIAQTQHPDCPRLMCCHTRFKLDYKTRIKLHINIYSTFTSRTCANSFKDRIMSLHSAALFQQRCDDEL